MDKITQYRQVIQQLLETIALDSPYSQLVFDPLRDRYLLIHSSWDDNYRVYGCAIHLDLIDEQIWIQHNATEIELISELKQLGVAPEDIILGFRSPQFRAILAAQYKNH
jgi:XisI protein